MGLASKSKEEEEEEESLRIGVQLEIETAFVLFHIYMYVCIWLCERSEWAACRTKESGRKAERKTTRNGLGSS